MTGIRSTRTTAELADWIDAVHLELGSTALEAAGARWGPVTLRHRTCRPEWFGVYDHAWARPEPGSAPDVEVDLLTAAIADLPGSFAAPPRAGDGHLESTRDHDGVVAWHPRTRRAVHLRHGPPDDYDAVSPLRPLVHWTVTDAGGVLVHAAVVGRPIRSGGPARGLLLVGEAGFGKSTTTLACLERGWVTCGDDTVAVFPGPGGWWAEAVYAAVKTKIDATVPVPDGIQLRSWKIGDRKWVHRLTGTDAERLCDRLPLDGVIVLVPGAAPDAPVAAVTSAAARTAVAPSTVAGMPDRQAHVLRMLGRVCHDLPAFALPRREDLGRAVAELADTLQASQPSVAVVVPVHDGESLVTDAIDSVVGQTCGRFEIVAVDDASGDASVDVLEACRARVEAAGHSLAVLRLDTNVGVAGARNRGLAATTAPLVAFVDQDDRWTPDHVAVLAHELHRAEADVAFGRVVFSDLAPGAHRPWAREEWFVGDHPGHVLGAALLRREVLDGIGALDESVGTYDDVDWYLRMRDSDLVIATADHVVLDRRVHSTNQSRHTARQSSSLLNVVRRHIARVRDALPLDVVIPVHDGLVYLPEAVASALDQEDADVRVIVVDDGSTDGVQDAVGSLGDPRVTCIRHDVCRGIGAARNTGVAHAEREWLAFLDADDRWPLDRTRRLAEALAADPGGIAVGRVGIGPDLDVCAEADPASLPPATLAGGILCRRATFDRVGRFEESLRVGEWIDWMARARSLGIVEHGVELVSLLRRVHETNTTRTRRGEFSDYLRVVAMARARSG